MPGQQSAFEQSSNHHEMGSTQNSQTLKFQNNTCNHTKDTLVWSQPIAFQFFVCFFCFFLVGFVRVKFYNKKKVCKMTKQINFVDTKTR